MKKILSVLLICCLPLFSLVTQASTVSASAAIVICGNTGEVVFEKNADCRLAMASTTKIMTALLLCEAGDPETVVHVTKEMATVEGSSMGLLPGDTVTYRALLYGMLLASGNDAANTTAIALAGSVENFVVKMNEKAAALKLANTHFDTPSGLDGESHYTTARDLANLTRYAMQNELFAAGAGTYSETLYYGNPPYRRTLKNHNRLLKEYDGSVGVKTGFTKKAGRCLVSAAKRDGKYVICVTLNDPNDWQDHKKLCDYAFEQLPVYVEPPKPPEPDNPVPIGFEPRVSLFDRFLTIIYYMLTLL